MPFSLFGTDRAAGDRSFVSSTSRAEPPPSMVRAHAFRIWSAGPTNTAAPISAAALRTVALCLARKLLREGYMDVKVCTPRGRVLQSDEFDELKPPKEVDMAKGQQRGNREAKKPKKEKAKVIAAAPSRKEAAWQPDFGPAKKKK